MRRATLSLAFASAAAFFFFASRGHADGYGALVTTTPASSAEPGAPPPAPDVDKPPQRRNGLVLGIQLGGGIASAAGYPNNSNEIGDPNYYAASGLVAGTGGGAFVMGALTDYLNFGFWFGEETFGNGQWHSTGGGGGLKVEVFPLYPLGGVFRDLGVFTQFGIGSTTLVYKPNPNVVSSGVGSFLGAGVFYEHWLMRALGGHFAAGPTLEYDAIVSEPMERHGALLGLRFLWYSGK
jgi:hypothetical protein